MSYDREYPKQQYDRSAVGYVKRYDEPQKAEYGTAVGRIVLCGRIPADYSAEVREPAAG